MKIYKFLINQFKSIFNFLIINMQNTAAPLKYQGNTNVLELLDLISITRYYLFDPFVRMLYSLAKMRYENLFFFLFKGKLKNKPISQIGFATYCIKFFRKRIRFAFCFNTLALRLNYLKNKNKVLKKKISFKIFAVSYLVVCGTIVLGAFFTYKDQTYKDYYMKLYYELFSKGFWKSSIFKIFLFKGQNYVEDIMQYEGNSIFSFIKVIIRKIYIHMYNTYFVLKSIIRNKRAKIYYKNILVS